MTVRSVVSACLAMMLVFRSVNCAASELLTINVGSLRPEEDFVSGFSVRLSHAHILQVCVVPIGWSLTVSNPAEFGLEKGRGSELSGEAMVMHDAFTGHHHTSSLAVALIEHDAGVGPMIVGGTLSLFVLDGQNTQRVLGPQSISLAPASHCPATANVR